MNKQFVKIGILGLAAAFAMTSCSDEQQFTDYNKQAKDIDVQVLNPSLPRCATTCPCMQ